MSGYDRYFLEGLKRLGINGNLLEAIMESHKACFPTMEGFAVHSPSERYVRGSKVTREKIDEIVNGLDEFEREVYNDMSVDEKRLFIADMINNANGVSDTSAAKVGVDEKIIKSYMRKIARMHKHKEMMSREEEREAKREIRRMKEEHKSTELSDPNFGGVPIKYRTSLYVYKKTDYSEEYKNSHPGEKGKFDDLMLFVTNAVENPENYMWWDKLSDSEKEKAMKESSRKHVVFALRTDVGDGIGAKEIKDTFTMLIAGKAPSDIVPEIDKDSAFLGFGKGKTSGRAEANRMFFDTIPKSILTDEYEEVEDLSELEGFVLASGDRARTEHEGKKEEMDPAEKEERDKKRKEEYEKEMKERVYKFIKEYEERCREEEAATADTSEGVTNQ